MCVCVFTMPGERKLSPEVQEEAATLMFGVRMLLENVDSATLKAAYTILCKVNTEITHPPHCL